MSTLNFLVKRILGWSASRRKNEFLSYPTVVMICIDLSDYCCCLFNFVLILRFICVELVHSRPSVSVGLLSFCYCSCVQVASLISLFAVYRIL